MWKKQKTKRIFKSFICMALAVLIFITDVPDLGLVLKVMLWLIRSPINWQL